MPSAPDAGRLAGRPVRRREDERILRGRTRYLDDIDPPARVCVPALMRGYLRLGAQVCGEPAHDPDFGVGDFPALLDKRRADTRYLKRLRSVGAATAMVDGAHS